MSLIHGITATTYITTPAQKAYAFLVNHTGPNDIAYTSDGITWQLTEGDSTIDGVNHVVELLFCSSFGTLVCITFNNSLDLIRVFVSTDGENWTLTDSGTIDGGDTLSSSSMAAAYSPSLGRIIVLATKTNSPIRTIIGWSDDGGYTWSRSTSEQYTIAGKGSVDWSENFGNFYRAMGSVNPNSSQQLARSPTGMAGTWTYMTDPSENSVYRGVLCIDEIEKVIAVGSNVNASSTGRILVSNTSGTFPPTFSSISGSAPISGSGYYFEDLAYSPELDRIVVVSGSNSNLNTVVYSDDQGDSWTAIDPGFGSSGFGNIVWSSDLGLFLAGGDEADGAWGYSSDGISWTQIGLSGLANNGRAISMVSGDGERFIPS